jgi:hypothetical protein
MDPIALPSKDEREKSLSKDERKGTRDNAFKLVTRII